MQSNPSLRGSVYLPTRKASTIIVDPTRESSDTQITSGTWLNNFLSKTNQNTTNENSLLNSFVQHGSPEKPQAKGAEARPVIKKMVIEKKGYVSSLLQHSKKAGRN